VFVYGFAAGKAAIQPAAGQQPASKRQLLRVAKQIKAWVVLSGLGTIHLPEPLKTTVCPIQMLSDLMPDIVFCFFSICT